MEKLSDNWLKTAINEDRVFLLGIDSLYHGGFSFFISVRPPRPWNDNSVWWEIWLDENNGKLLITKYESARMSHSGSGKPDGDARVGIDEEELRFWEKSEVFHDLIYKVVDKLEKAVNDNRVSYSLSNKHRDFSEVKETLKKLMKNAAARYNIF